MTLGQPTGNACLACKHVYSCGEALRRHLRSGKCRGVDLLTCPTCHKRFATPGSRRNHVNQVRCVPSEPAGSSGGTLTTGGQTIGDQTAGTINNVVDNRQNLTFNFYGTEDLAHILSNPKRMDGYIGRCYMAIPAMIRDVHYDPQHPENHTLRLNNVRDKFMQVRSNEGWITKMFKEVIDNLIDRYGNELQEHLESSQCAIKLRWVRDHFLKMMEENVERPYDKKKRKVLENEVMMVMRDGRGAVK